MKSKLKELEESIRKLEELKKSRKDREIAADVESGLLAVESIVEGKAESIRRSMDKKFREIEGILAAVRTEIESLKNSAVPVKIASAGEAPAGSDRKLGEKVNELSGKVETIRASLLNANSAFNGLEARFGALLKEMDLLKSAEHQDFSKSEMSGKHLDEKLRLFALNADVEKVWKELESLRRYTDEKAKYAESLANSLQTWESKRLGLMARELEFEEKLRAFPELKLLEGRLRKIERSLTELQRHFVAAQLTEPIVME